MKSKLELANNIYTDNLLLFRCPICHSDFNLQNNSLVCYNNHTFNISKKGTTMLYKTSKLKKNDLYTSELFTNRRDFINSNFYMTLIDNISNIIKSKYKNPIILDIGCGEGTFGFFILNRIKNKFSIGIDLAKEGVELASDYLNSNYLPIIADINNIPLKDKTIDVIIDILSPVNKEEIYRLLKTDGIIIKVTPKKDYLKELRNIMNINDYENEVIIENNILNNYKLINKIELCETYNLSENNFKNLIKMTPLTKYKNIYKVINEVTIALNIYVLEKKE